MAFKETLNLLIVLLALVLDDEEKVVDVGGEHVRDVRVTHFLRVELDEELFEQCESDVLLFIEDPTVQQVRLDFALYTSNT